ncbi:helix-turn-helix transcriptional regulator [Alkaliphilus peptidifermentans]|uniref:CBS domain-containing protein n=1 Tax=Alkaliphilus peptidifermentans DSM 18978 TaxID=1120976 RepID=A0A1G5BTP7_9FIRM|nr:helix-turn-helix transcriptional regulator [Alkaliphilus peptidifermentans]SCX93447.1 CBS domain-containing protein [Alkaliphilus peptidifermentans DSM 18978]
MVQIELSKRQQRIIEIVKEQEPITSENIASILSVTRATLRPDLAILTMSGILDARPKVGYFYSGKTEINLFSQEIKNIKVSDIMSVPVIVTENTSVYDAIVSLFLEDVGTIFVVSNGYLMGVVSRKDLLKATLGGNDINKVPVAMIMTRSPNIITIIKDDNALNAAIKIIDHEVDSLPVVEKIIKDEKEQLKIVGKVSKSNITKLLVEICKGGS